MVDVRLDGKNNQKKIGYVAATREYATGENYTVFSLPSGSVVVRAGAVVTTADSTSGAALSIKVNGTEVASVNADVAGIDITNVTDLAGFASTGGTVTVEAGGAGDGKFIVILEVVDVTRTNGEYIG